MSRTPLAIALLLGLGAVLLVPGLAAGDSFVAVTAETNPDQPVAGDEFELAVTIDRADGDSGLESVERVAVYDESTPGDEPIEEVSPGTTVAPDASETVTVEELEREERGVHDFRVEVTMADGSGTERTVTTRLPVQIYSQAPQVEVDAGQTVPGARQPVNVTVANGLDEPISGVSVSVDGDEVSFTEAERVTGSIAGGSDFTANFEGTVETAGVYDLDVTVEYEDPDGQVRRTTETVPVDFTGPDNPGRVELTGVSVDGGAGTVEISGSAANTGSQSVDSVVVAVGETETVQPAQPQPEYFVGSVDASGFSSFTVHADVSGNGTTIPLTVEYTVDDVRQTATREVSFDGGGSAAPQPNENPAAGGGTGTLPVVGVVVLLGLVGAAIYVRR